MRQQHPFQMNTFLLLLLFLSYPFDNTLSDDEMPDLYAISSGHPVKIESAAETYVSQYCQDSVKQGGMRYNMNNIWMSFAFCLFMRCQTSSIPALSYALSIISIYITSTSASSISLIGFPASSINNLYQNSIFENVDLDGRTKIMMGDGFNYTDFIIIHPLVPSGYVEWQLNALYTDLTGVIGLADDSQCINDTGSTQFLFYVDAGTDYTSQIFTNKTQFENIAIDVSGSNTLRIETWTVDGSDDCDHAIIANPLLQVAPTLQPTPSPTANTNDPSSAPTMEPTFDPSLVPTLEPIIDPTREPTTNPTEYPSIPPTLTPTFSPSFSPTQNPTRYPTVSRAYDSFFSITYLIKNLENDFIEILLKHIWDVTADITEIIEQSYMESTGLQFKFFWLEIDDMLGYKIEDIDEKKYPQFLHAKHEISLGSRIKCDITNCETLLNSEDFESIAQTKLRRYFPVYWLQLNAAANNSSQLIFEIESYGKLDELYPAPPTMFEVLADNKVLVVLSAIMVVMFIISCFSFCHLKGTCCCAPMDDTIWNALMIYGLQLIVFASDINLCFELVFHQDFDTDPRIKICGICCIVFIVVPYVTNLFCGSKITSIIASENDNAINFFQERKVVFMILIVICGGCYPVVFLLSSGIFGLELFCAGLTNYEITKMNKIKLIATICLNNIPQICIQCSYVATIHRISPNTAFAFIASILSIICTPIRIKNASADVRAIPYYIEIKIMSGNDDDTDGDKKKFILNKGKIGKMSKILCEAVDCPENNIEVSRNSKVFFSINFSSRQQATLGGSGVALYVMHFVNKHEMNISGIIKLYQARDQFLKNEFKKHFGLNGACMIKFKSAGGMFQVLIDESKANETNFDELLKEVMDVKGLNYNSISDRQKILSTLYDNNNNGTTNVTNNGEEVQKQTYSSDVELQPLNNNNNQTERQIFDGLVLNQQELTIDDIFNEQLP